MRIVLDTNVLVSGLLNEEGSPAVVLDLILSGAVQLVYCPSSPPPIRASRGQGDPRALAVLCRATRATRRGTRRGAATRTE